MVTEQSEAAVGLCWECGYSLRGLESRRCPECGRPFDPTDPATMNMGRRVGWLTGWLMRPPGVVIYGLTALAIIVSLWGAATPGPGGEYAHYVLSRAFSPSLRQQFWDHDLRYSEHTGRFVLAVLAWAGVLALWVLRRVARGIAVRRLSRQKPATFAYWRRWLVTPVVLGFTLLICRTPAPVWLGFALSRGDLDRAAAAGASPADEWIGVYPPVVWMAPQVFRGRVGEVWVHVRYDGGFVRSGDRPPPEHGTDRWSNPVSRRFRAMGGGWYAFHRKD